MRLVIAVLTRLFVSGLFTEQLLNSHLAEALPVEHLEAHLALYIGSRSFTHLATIT